MGYGNRLTADQIAALNPGDTVTIESGAEVGRPRHSTGTVTRIGTTHLTVSVPGPRGRGKFIERPPNQAVNQALSSWKALTTPQPVERSQKNMPIGV